jgi:hypothetical protein
MARIKPQGALTWTASTSADVDHYRIYQGADGNDPTYDSPYADVGKISDIRLPIDGLPPVEGTVKYAVSAFDVAGNESDLTPALAVLVDVTPPAAPTDLAYNPDF